MEDRKLRNREHARRSRLKKKGMEIQLKESMEQLKQENQNLRDFIASSTAVEDVVDVDTMVQEYVNRPTANFIKAVKQPEHRVLDTKTIQFLQSLSKELATTGSSNNNKKKKKQTSPKSTAAKTNNNLHRPMAVVGWEKCNFFHGRRATQVKQKRFYTRTRIVCCTLCLYYKRKVEVKKRQKS